MKYSQREEDAIQEYFECFVDALNKWTRWQTRSLIQNRVQLLLSLCDLFATLAEGDGSNIAWIVDLRNESNDKKQINSFDKSLLSSSSSSLSPTSSSSVMRDLCDETGDSFMMLVCRRTLADHLENSAIAFFKEILLPPLSGFSEERWSGANKMTRFHLKKCVHQIFSSGKSDGKLSLEKHLAPLDMDYQTIIPCNLVKLNRVSNNIVNTFLTDLVETEYETLWDDTSTFIGQEVAQVFLVSKANARVQKSQLFVATVTKHASESYPGAEDQQFEVTWVEDGTVWIWDEEQYKTGRQLFLDTVDMQQ